ncbi:MAG: PQQ-dependent sugar dehydrogenase [Desulfuromonadaceae bacterium]|nr:PQQ-dependent sugar dehydrogenase [Desulfuromonas sp.]MDY0185825.1 PQQ-dependent sugar dehydrogenase [Desulfuromonadaceae bacterium]
MKAVFSFLAFFVLLCGAVLLILGLKAYRLDSPPLLFIAMLGVGFVLALIGKRWGRGALLLAAPLAILLAYIGAQRLLPPAPATPAFAQVYCLNPEKAKLQRQHGNLRPRAHTHTQTLTLVCPDDTELVPRFVLLAGIELQPVACGLKGVSGLVFGADKALYASIPDADLIYRLEPPETTTADSRSHAMGAPRQWRKTILTAALDSPMGLAWHGDSLYVATRTAVVKLTPGTTTAAAAIQTAAVQTVVDHLPSATPTERRAILVDDTGCVYLSVGAVDSDPLDLEWQRGAILEIAPHGESRLFATGIHHARTMAWHPQTGALWLGEDSPQTLDFSPPKDEINAVCAGEDFGWPFCYGFKTPDLQLGTTTMCADTTAPLLTLPPHSVPAGLAFGAQLDAPEQYRSMVYVALAGDKNDIHRQGFRILGLPLDTEGDITGWGIEVALGWATPQEVQDHQEHQEHIYGQPATLAVGPDGNLYLADSHAGVVYRFVFDSESKSDSGSAYIPPQSE